MIHINGRRFNDIVERARSAMDDIPVWLYVTTVMVTGIFCYVGGYIEGHHRDRKAEMRRRKSIEQRKMIAIAELDETDRLATKDGRVRTAWNELDDRVRAAWNEFYARCAAENDDRPVTKDDVQALLEEIKKLNKAIQELREQLELRI
jgi:hypothetical protein